MIDKDKIKSAAQGYCDATYGTINEHPLIEEAFKEGANWAINEFFKNLWHPASNKPRKGTICLIQMKLINGHGLLEYTTAIYIGEGKWTNIYISDDTDMKILRWLYIDDLLLK